MPLWSKYFQHFCSPDLVLVSINMSHIQEKVCSEAQSALKDMGLLQHGAESLDKAIYGHKIVNSDTNGQVWSVYSLPFSIFMVSSLVDLMCFLGADHHSVHRLPGPDLFLLLCLLGGEGCCGWGGQDGLLQLRRCPVVGRGKAAELDNRSTLYKRSKPFTDVFVLVSACLHENVF